MIKPPRLRPGATIGIISPAGPVEREKTGRAADFLRDSGYAVRLGKNIFEKTGYLAGTDAARYADLIGMFLDPDIDAILLSRGGYGSGRLLDMIDYESVRECPKILVGYSDATALMTALYAKTGLISFSGPMAAPDFGGKKVSKFTLRRFFPVLSDANNELKLSACSKTTVRSVVNGSGGGVVLCGCLSLFCSVAGTEYWPGDNDIILALEDIGEEPYRIDRAVNTLVLHRVFEKVRGIVLGQFVKCGRGQDAEEEIREIFAAVGRKFGFPVLENLSYGHIHDKLTVPFGARGTIDTQSGAFIIRESVVE